MARATCCPGSCGAIPREQEAKCHFASTNKDGTSKPESLPRSRIIRRRGVFETTRNQGRRVSNRFMTLNFLSEDEVKSSETGTVAFLTPKRLGAATVRNKLRRRMREIYRRNLAQSSEGAFLIWIARPPATELPFEELKKCMTALLKRRADS